MLLNFDPSIVFWCLGNFLQDTWCMTSPSSFFPFLRFVAWNMSMVARALAITLLDNQDHSWEGGQVHWKGSLDAGVWGTPQGLLEPWCLTNWWTNTILLSTTCSWAQSSLLHLRTSFLPHLLILPTYVHIHVLRHHREVVTVLVSFGKPSGITAVIFEGFLCYVNEFLETLHLIANLR